MPGPTTTKLRMPSLFHEVFGAWQTPLSLGAIAAGATLAALVWLPSLEAPAWWRAILASLLLLDIAAGAVANFSQGTNDHYKARPLGRCVFIALHLHVLAIGWLLGEPLLPYLAVWAYTIATASIVNLLYGSRSQTLLAGCFVCLGIIAGPVLPLSELGQAASLLFLVKVTFSFAVDHYA